MTIPKATEKWHTSESYASRLCNDGLVAGAVPTKQGWAIPSETRRPVVRKAIGKSVKVKPIIKWAGGKSQILSYINEALPPGLGDTITRYAEPFIGGAAVLLNLQSTYDFDEVYISDVNRELVTLYKTVRDHPDDLVEILSGYQKDHLSRDMDERKEYFYARRQDYNEVKASNVLDATGCAALFVYLNKTCFNGLYRVNAKGEFNVPSGVYKNPLICDSENILNVSQLLQGVIIENADYLKSSDFIDDRTFVYFDPPYRPLTETASFTSYTEGQFNDDDQKRLAEYVCELDRRGARVMVSNSDPKNSDPNDEFFDELYSGMCINRIPANRMINSNAAGRGKINELLITNYPSKPVQTGIENFL